MLGSAQEGSQASLTHPLPCSLTCEVTAEVRATLSAVPKRPLYPVGLFLRKDLSHYEEALSSAAVNVSLQVLVSKLMGV